MSSLKAIVESKLLTWARSVTKTPLEDAAKAAGIEPVVA